MLYKYGHVTIYRVGNDMEGASELNTWLAMSVAQGRHVPIRVLALKRARIGGAAAHDGRAASSTD